MKKILICILCVALLCTSLCACSLWEDRGGGNVNQGDGGTVTDTPDKTVDDKANQGGEVVPTAVPSDPNGTKAVTP